MSIGSARLKVSIDAGAQFVFQQNSFWNLSDVYAPQENFDPDRSWGEFYVKPGLLLTLPSAPLGLKAGVSVVASKTVGEDVFAEDGQGRLLLEDAYAAISYAGTGWTLDLSGGAQPHVIGSGMLLSDGGVDGFERGALIFGPRRAWAMTGLARLSTGKLTVEAFHLDARELPSSDTRTLVNGARAEVALGQDRFIGLAFAHVPRSDAPYVQAAPGGNGAPTLLFGGRDGLRFVHAYAKVSPITSAPGLWIAADHAWQWNDRIDMRASGGRFELGYMVLESRWRPTLSWTFQRFSGDDPNTARLERFDPLFYEGSPSGWATGTNGSFVFINSNVRAHKLTLSANPSQRDIVTFRYAAVSADKLRSPLQFGQATRPDFTPGAPGLITGVTQRKLSDDILFEYTRIVSPNIYLTAGIAHSWAGPGIDEIALGSAADWTGGFANLVVRY
jgi:hypothetical protein